MNENSLNNKLDRVDAAIADMRKRIVLNESASIEEIAAATDLKSCTNIFIQETEPEIKEGIWFQADAESHPYDTIAVDNETIVPYKWQLNNKIAITSMYGCQGQPYGVYKNYFLKVGEHGYLHVHDMNDNMKHIKTIAGSSYSIQNRVYLKVVGNRAYEIHNGCNGRMQIFNLDSLTYEGDKPLSLSALGYFTYNELTNSFYYGSGSSNYKYDLATHTATKLSTANFQSNQNMAISFGPYVWYLRDNSWGIVKDLNTDTIVNVPQSLRDKYFTTAEVNTGIAVVEIDEYVYCITLNKSFKVNKTTLEAEWVTDLFKEADVGKIFGGVMYEGTLYGVTGDSVTKSYLTPMSFISKEYPNNCAILVQSPLRNTLIQTQLWTYLKRNPFSGRILYSLYDAYYYNKELGLIRDMPTYYGDGTQWIKFKN